jgi:hypothetical protein
MVAVVGGGVTPAARVRPEMLEFAVRAVSHTRDSFRMEINPIRRQIEELKQRTDALRGYL